MKKFGLFTFFILFFSVTSVFASNGTKGDWEFGPHVGAGFPDSYRGLNPDAGVLFGAQFSYATCDHFSLELSGHRLFSEISTGDETTIDSYRVNGLWNFKNGEKVRPFLTVGGGIERSIIGSIEKHTNVAPNVGAGVKWYLSDHGGLRLDGRYIPVHVGGAIDAWEHNMEGYASFFLVFGKKSEAPAPAPTAAPTTAPKVEATPEPTATPAPVATVAPAPVDTDKDGVTDDKDKCPNTAEGTKVDEAGCPPEAAKARGVLKGVNFKTASNELTDGAKKVLDEVATTLNGFPNVKIEVQGHTDSAGNENNNMKLSAARAQAAMDYLVSKGVAKERMTSKGYGITKPIADNNTKEGRKANRRVELNWLD